MAAVDPTTYSWLSTSTLQVAGCVTVVSGAEPAAVAAAFGHREDELVHEATFGERAGLGELGDGREIGVAATGGSTLVVELNGFEGTRAEVLREASRAGDKVAASLYWSVNGAVRVTCARRGKVVASFELPPYDEDELAEVPRALRKLARLALEDDEGAENAEDADEGGDPLAIGAAMLETYTGVGFTQADVDGSRVLPIVSRPADIRTYTTDRREFRPLDHQLPGVQDALEELPPDHQRTLAEWAAAAAVREAGLAGDPTLRAVLDQHGTGLPATLPPALEEMRRRAAQELQRQQKLVDDDLGDASHGALALHHAALPGAALEAVRYTSHADPYSAAVGALTAAASTFASTRLERGVRFADDERGRYLGAFDPSPRAQEFAHVVGEVLVADPGEWHRLAERLPTPLTADELTAAADRDRRWQEAGAFTTWQVVPSAYGESVYDENDEDDEDDEDISEIEREFLRGFDRDTQVRARYEEITRRDEARAARGPIAVEVLAPANPGGFAVQLSDGTRIERLPAGVAFDTLWLTYVFQNDFGEDPFDGLGRRARPSERISYDGPRGRIPSPGGAGGGGGGVSDWRVRLDVTGLDWVRLTYLDDGVAAASETIRISQVPRSS